MFKKAVFLSLVVLCVNLISCGAAAAGGDEYDGLVADGWVAYENKDYAGAADLFSQAVIADPERAEAYTGLGWTEMRRDNLNEADGQFEIGSFKDDASSDLYAGWAFASNASKAYTNSNSRASTALSGDPTWAFVHDATLDHKDLHILKAENFFALGQFGQALTEVQTQNGSFSADVSTSGGQAELAAEIERLKGISKPI